MHELTQIPLKSNNSKEETSLEKKLPVHESESKQLGNTGLNIKIKDRNPAEHMTPKYDPQFQVAIPKSSQGTIQMMPKIVAESAHEKEENAESDDSEIQLAESSTKDFVMGGADDNNPDKNKSTNIQPKLKIGKPGDKFEKEADTVANRVMNMKEDNTLNMSTGFSAIQINMKCSECQEEEEEIQMQPLNNRAVEPLFQSEEEEELIQKKTAENTQKHSVTDLNQNLNNTKGNGKTLSAEITEKFGTKIGADFSNVNIHTDSNAVKMNRQLGARAFTHGNDIYFNQGQFNPQSYQGAHLLAHELTHTVQQGAVQRIQKKENQPEISNNAKVDVLQRTCDASQITEGLDMENLNEVDRRVIERRIRECAASDVANLQNVIAGLPDNPLDATQVRDDLKEQFRIVLASLREGIQAIEHHEDEPNRRIRRAHLENVLNLMTSNKLISYHIIAMMNMPAMVERVAHISDTTVTLDAENLQSLANVDRSVSQNPERFILSKQVTAYYNLINVQRPDFGDSAFQGTGSEADLTVNAPSLGAEIIGPNKQVRNSTGTYTMRLDYSVAGRDLLSQVVEAMNWVNYRWEVYDITTLFQRRIDEQVARLRAREAEETPVPTGPSAADVELDAMRNQAVSDANESGRMDAAERRWERYVDNQIEDFENNLSDLANPDAASDGSLIDTISTSLIAEFNLATTGLAATFGALAELINTFSDLLGGSFNEKEIPFPNRDGWFLIRCIAQPNPRGEGETALVRPASVATKIVSVREIRAFTEQELADIDANLEARRLEIETNLLFVTDPHEREILEAEMAAVVTEQTGSSVQILESRIAQLNDLKSRITDPARIRDIDDQLEKLQDQLDRANDLGVGDMIDSTIVRPRAVFVSEETSQTYPLLFQLGQVSGSEIRYRLLDVGNPDGGQWHGQGATITEAVHRAFVQFSRESPYGEGHLTVQLSGNAPFTLQQTGYECDVRGGAQALRRLEQLVTVLTILGLMAVPGAGPAAAAIGAGIAAARIIGRIQNQTFRWDTAAVTDVLSILGAAASGAAAVGRMRVVRTARLFAVVADDADVIRLISAMNRTASRLELIDEFLNWGGYMWGNAVLLGELAEIQALEIRGPGNGGISNAEARRRRASRIAGAIRDGGFQFAGFRPSETARRINDSFGPGHPGSTEGGSVPHDDTAPRTDSPPIIPEPPARSSESVPEGTPERIPDTERLPDAERVPESTTGVPTQPSTGPTIAERQVQIDRLTASIGEIPPGLHDLLMFDHNLLQRSLEDPSIITAANKHAWNEIGMLGGMRPETYDVLLHNDGLRQALIDNPRAAEALRHCASPCFPPNASADDVLALQQLLTERALAGLETNMNALNEFLYEHRSAGDLGDVIRMLRTDFEGTIQQTGAASQLILPESWAEGSDARPSRLTSVLSYFQTMEIPKGLINSILENIHRLPEAEQRAIINDELNFLLSRRAAGEYSLTADRLLYGLSDPATFAMSRFLLERFRNQAGLVDVILGRTSMESFQHLRDGSSAMEPRELIQRMASLLSRIQSDNPSDILHLIERAGYPAPEEGSTNPDIDRLIDLLNRNGSETPLTPAEAWAVVEHANAAREAVAGGDLNLPFSADAVRGDTSRTSLGSKLRHHIDQIIMQSDALPQIFNQILGGETGTVVDSVRFGEVSEVIRAQIERLIRIDLADQFEHPLTDRQVQAMVNSIWRPKRGVLFERVHDFALRRLHGENNVWRQAGVSTQTGTGTAARSVPTVVDNIVLIREGNVLRVLFFEYKAGGGTEEPGQSALREHITSGGGLDGIAFDTPRSREVFERIEAARQDGATIQLEHIPVNEEG
ncbi:MAG TPA: DUF4157 domain-containing protein [Draconibacterium sp.]|nr:DUF4157 domain-containing protein [Draconibacterium sp.]